MQEKEKGANQSLWRSFPTHEPGYGETPFSFLMNPFSFLSYALAGAASEKDPFDPRQKAASCGSRSRRKSGKLLESLAQSSFATGFCTTILSHDFAADSSRINDDRSIGKQIRRVVSQKSKTGTPLG